jgi:hypothetical protein
LRGLAIDLLMQNIKIWLKSAPIMATGLLALLDDIAALVKVSAASLDDIPAQVSKTTGKVSGIVIDDAAVTPKYCLLYTSDAADDM